MDVRVMGLNCRLGVSDEFLVQGYDDGLDRYVRILFNYGLNASL